MKHFVLIFVLLLTAVNSEAQDTIVKRTAEKTAAKILEINTAEVKYKRFDYQDGPVFTLKTWEIKYIVYANGVKESFENYSKPSTMKNDSFSKKDFLIQPAGNYYYYQGLKITEPDMLDIVKKVNDKKINLMAEKTMEKRFMQKSFLFGGAVIGSVALLTASGVITVFNSAANTPNTIGRGRGARNAARTQQLQTGGYILLGSLCSELASVSFKIQEKHHAHIAVDAYNKFVSQ